MGLLPNSSPIMENDENTLNHLQINFLLAIVGVYTVFATVMLIYKRLFEP